MNITTTEALRQLYAQPAERAVKKQISALDVHCKSFIALSPFALLATSDLEHNMDASPRGGAPGFVRVDAALIDYSVSSVTAGIEALATTRVRAVQL